MIITAGKDTNRTQMQEKLMSYGLTVHFVERPTSLMAVLVGDTKVLQKDERAVLEKLGALAFMATSKPHKLVSREFYPTDTVVTIGNVQIGGRQVHVIAGPCSVETQDQMHKAASGVQAAGCRLIRGGAYKPRTSPYAFQGHGEEGLEYLCKAARPLGLPIVTELMDIRHLDLFLKHGIEAIQIGTRNMQNFDLLKEIGRTQIPIILKRGMSATVKEWLMSAEYIAANGNPNIILCERGIRTFEPAYRNTLDITAVMFAKKETHLPVIVDPSHAGGEAWMVAGLSHAALAIGADGLLIEMHPDPSQAWSDAEQALNPGELQDLMASLNKVAKTMGRTLL